jgi:hypothetical protein
MPFTKNSWVCYEWSWNLKTSAWSAWTDGKLVDGLNFTAQPNGCYHLPPAITSMAFGWTQSHGAQDKLSMWMDALALSPTRVGCPQGSGH